METAITPATCSWERLSAYLRDRPSQGHDIIIAKQGLKPNDDQEAAFERHCDFTRLLDV